MQARRRFLVLCFVAVFVLVVYLLKPIRKPNALLRLADDDDDDDDVDNLPSFMDDWKPSLEVGRPPAAKTYKARQQTPFRTSYRKTNKNCRFDNHS